MYMSFRIRFTTPLILETIRGRKICGYKNFLNFQELLFVIQLCIFGIHENEFKEFPNDSVSTPSF